MAHIPTSLPSLAKARKLIWIVIFAASIFVLGYYFGYKGYKVNLEKFSKVTITREVPGDKSELNFSLFWKVWDILASSYFDKTKLNPRKMVYGAIGGMVASLGDPYTVFLTPEDNKIVQEDLNGSFEGVGIQIGFKGTQLVVISPLPGSPAEKAGVKAGDFIIGIKDETKNIDKGTSGISLPEAVKVIRGKARTRITLVLLREAKGDPFEVEIVRERLEISSLSSSYVGEDEKILHVKISKFGQETFTQWQKTVQNAKGRDIKAVILDLRNNPGGYLQAAVDVASEFLKVGSSVVIEEHANGTKNEFKVERLGVFLDKAAIVLINQGSASASEILAGALRDGRKVKIVGEKSFGKGSIQEPKQIDGGAGLHITVARWLTPGGFWVDEKGLDPDVKIEDNSQTEEDEQLQEAIKLLQ